MAQPPKDLLYFFLKSTPVIGKDREVEIQVPTSTGTK